mmetsp:Transcript_16748/g.46805  ORF Transcript_16748/g.46805 Transcript_16748/m.46805 type:complete len:236 (-) Transcript_16748:1413-2120(-)
MIVRSGSTMAEAPAPASLVRLVVTARSCCWTAGWSTPRMSSLITADAMRSRRLTGGGLEGEMEAEAAWRRPARTTRVLATCAAVCWPPLASWSSARGSHTAGAAAAPKTCTQATTREATSASSSPTAEHMAATRRSACSSAAGPAWTSVVCSSRAPTRRVPTLQSRISRRAVAVSPLRLSRTTASAPADRGPLYGCPSQLMSLAGAEAEAGGSVPSLLSSSSMGVAPSLAVASVR